MESKRCAAPGIVPSLLVGLSFNWLRSSGCVGCCRNYDKIFLDKKKSK